MNIAQWLARSAARAPDSPAICSDEADQISYAQLHDTAGRIGAWIESRCGTRPARVALVGRNHPAYIATLFGAWYARATVVPVNFRLHPAEVRFILRDAGATLCVCDPDLRDALSAQSGSDDPDSLVRISDWQALAREAADEVALVPEPAHSDDLAWLFYTSGTTGKPKGVMLTHGNLLQMVLNFQADVLRPESDSTLVHFAPLSHGSGMYLLAFIAAGALNVVPPDGAFRSGIAVPLLNRYRRISMFLAPTMVRRLIDFPDIEAFDPQRLELVVYGGEPMPLAVIEAAVECLGPRLAQIYGQGESPMTITRLRRQEIERCAGGRDPARLASAGQAFTGVDVRVVDAAGNTVPAGDIGEVTVRGPTVMRGYWRQQQATRAQLRDGWLWTGDLGAMDRDGYLTLQGRSRDLIISGGLNIYAREVEETIAQHPRVAEVAVVGAPDAQWGERVVAFVVGRSGCRIDEVELDTLARSRIAGFKRPREYHFVADLPRNAYGKVLKRELRESLAGPAPAARDSSRQQVPTVDCSGDRM